MEWKLFANLAEAAGDREVTVEGDPDTVGDALSALVTEYPALREEVLDENGELQGHINLLVNGQNVAGAEGLDTPLGDDDELALFPPVSGGRVPHSRTYTVGQKGRYFGL